MVELGKSKLTTVLTPRKSMPRPIRSVATSTHVRPTLRVAGHGRRAERGRSIRPGSGCWLAAAKVMPQLPLTQPQGRQVRGKRRGARHQRPGSAGGAAANEPAPRARRRAHLKLSTAAWRAACDWSAWMLSTCTPSYISSLQGCVERSVSAGPSCQGRLRSGLKFPAIHAPRPVQRQALARAGRFAHTL